jgi:hypothetical protein
MSILKRQRELKKLEKAARKRAKRHGIREDGFQEPRPTIGAAEMMRGAPPPESAEAAEADSAGETVTEQEGTEKVVETE